MKRLLIICIALLLPVAALAWMNVTTVGGGGVVSEAGGASLELKTTPAQVTRYGNYNALSSGQFSVAAGDLVVIGVRLNSGQGAVTDISDTAGNTYTNAGRVTPTATATLDVFYTIATAASETDVFTVTYATSITDRLTLNLYIFSGGTISTDGGGNTGGSYTNNPKTGTFSTSGSDTVVIAFTAFNASRTLSNFEIGGVAADDEIANTENISSWYKIFSAAQTDIIAEVDDTGDTWWAIRAVAFKNE